MMEATIAFEADESEQKGFDAGPRVRHKTVEAQRVLFDGETVEWWDENGRRHERDAEEVVTTSSPEVEEIYEVERHDYSYDGPNRTRKTKSMESALELAQEEREEHRADEWGMRTHDDDNGRITFHPTDGTTGWVKIKTVELL